MCFRARYYCRHCHFDQRPENIHKCVHYRIEGKRESKMFLPASKVFAFVLTDVSSVNKQRRFLLVVLDRSSELSFERFRTRNVSTSIGKQQHQVSEEFLSIAERAIPFVFSPPRTIVHHPSKPFCFDTTGMFYWCPTQTLEQQTIVREEEKTPLDLLCGTKTLLLGSSSQM